MRQRDRDRNDCLGKSRRKGRSGQVISKQLGDGGGGWEGWGGGRGGERGG